MSFLNAITDENIHFTDINIISNEPTITSQNSQAASISLKKSPRASQRRMKAEIVNSVKIQEASNELLDALTRYGNNPYGIPAIHCAIMMGDENAVRLFLDHGASPNCIIHIGMGEEPNTPLDYAAKYGQLNIVKLLIERGAKIRQSIPNHLHEYIEECEIRPSITFAAQGNHSEIVKFLAENGAAINHSYSNYNPIFWAIKSGSFDSLQTLLDLGGTLDHLTKLEDLLGHAARSGRIEMLRFLLDRNVPIEVKDRNSWALYEAVVKQNVEMAKLLISHGAKVHTDNQLSSVLLAAINIDNPQIIEILIKASPSDLNNALFEATRLGKINAVKALINAGGNVNARGIGNREPLIFSSVQWPEILQLLINKGADINPVFDGGNTTLHYAVRNGVPESVHILIDSGAQINQKNASGMTPLHYAGASNEKTALALLERGADLNIPYNSDGKYLFPLFSLLQGQGNLPLIKEFIKRGAYGLNDTDVHGRSAVFFALYRTDGLLEYLVNEAGVSINAINAKDSYERTPFFYAVDFGNFKAMEILFKKGAVINVKDREGNTPLSVAIKKHQELVEWLVLNGAK